MALTLGDLIVWIRGDKSDLDKALKDSEKDAEGWSNRVGSAIGNGLTTLIGGAAIAVTGAITGIGVAAWDMASQTQEATNKFKTQLGASADEAERLKDVTLDIFGANFGNDMNDAADAVAAVSRNLDELGVTSDSEIQAAAQNAIMLRDAFGMDFNESITTIQSLMQNFGITSQEAFDFLVDAQQRGLDSSGDLQDTIKEYGPLFKEAGADLDNFQSLLVTGFQPGVLGTDKAADLFKEYFIRIQDGSESTASALEAIGINTTQFFDEMKDGSRTAASSFDEIMEGLADLDDPIQRNILGVQLFGTQWEDLGPEAANSITLANGYTEQLAGTTESLNAQYDTLGSLFQGVWRTFAVNVLGPIGDKLLNLGQTIVPFLTKAIQDFGAAISSGQGLGGVINALGTMIANAWPSIQTALGNLIMQMINWISANTGPFLTALQQWAQALIKWVIDAIPGLITNLGSVVQAILSWIGQAAPQVLQHMIQMGQTLIQWIADAMPGVLQALGNFLTGILNWVVESLPVWGSKLAEMGKALWQWVVDILPTLGTRLGEVLVVILNWIGNTIVTLGPKLLELAGKFIGWIATDVLPALPGKLWEILNALGTFLGNTMIELAPLITDLAKKFYNWITDEVLPEVPKKLGEVWDAITTWISDTAGKAWEAAKEIGKSIADGIGGAISDGLDALHGMVAAVINPIIDGINVVIDGMNLLGAGIGHIPRMAKGGWTIGGLTILGEEGPERVKGRGVDFIAGAGFYNLPSGLKVTPADKTANQMQGLFDDLPGQGSGGGINLGNMGGGSSNINLGNMGGGFGHNDPGGGLAGSFSAIAGGFGGGGINLNDLKPGGSGGINFDDLRPGKGGGIQAALDSAANRMRMQSAIDSMLSKNGKLGLPDLLGGGSDSIQGRFNELRPQNKLIAEIKIDATGRDASPEFLEQVERAAMRGAEIVIDKALGDSGIHNSFNKSFGR